MLECLLRPFRTNLDAAHNRPKNLDLWASSFGWTLSKGCDFVHYKALRDRRTVELSSNSQLQTFCAGGTYFDCHFDHQNVTVTAAPGTTTSVSGQEICSIDPNNYCMNNHNCSTQRSIDDIYSVC